MNEVTRKAAKRLIQKENPVILDVGACFFDDTKFFAQEYPKGKVYAFEPLASNIAKWDTTMRGIENATLVPFAVGAKKGEATFSTSVASMPPLSIFVTIVRGHLKELFAKGKVWVFHKHFGYVGYFFFVLPLLLVLGVVLKISGDVHWPLSGSLEQCQDYPSDWVFLAFRGTTKVNVTRLDDFYKETLNGSEIIDYMWTDVQGGERAMIEGGHETLQNTRFCQIEYGENASYSSVSVESIQFGFRFYLLTPSFAGYV